MYLVRIDPNIKSPLPNYVRKLGNRQIPLPALSERFHNLAHDLHIKTQ